MNSIQTFSKILKFCSVLLYVCSITSAIEPVKDEIDKVIEDDLTRKLGEDLLQSIEKKFQADLEKSVDTVLMKIKLLLQNGTTHIQDKLLELQSELDEMKNSGKTQVETCLTERQNDTANLAEKAMHQMVLCGYALIGHDPAKALSKVIELKQKIKDGLTPVYDKKKDVLDLLKVCGHDHDSLKKVVKCVISKSPSIKSAMMDVTNKLIEGIVDLTKMMAHGAMHEACLIEVVKTIEDEALVLLGSVRTCVIGNSSVVEEELKKYMKENNATVLEITKSPLNVKKEVKLGDKDEVNEMKTLIRRMLSNKDEGIDKKFKKKLKKIEQQLKTVDNNIV